MLRLRENIEAPQRSRIIANPGDISPVSPVAGGVIVNKLLFKPGGAVAPVNAKIMNQKAGSILAPAIGEKAGGTQLLHASINQRHAGAPLLPCP